MRERKYVVAGALLSLLFTLALVGNLAGADSLLALSRPVGSEAIPGSDFVGLDGPSDGLEKLLGPLTSSQEEGFT